MKLKCILCGTDYKELRDIGGPLHQRLEVPCRICGTYVITSEAHRFGPVPYVKERLHLLSAVSRHFHECGQGPLVVTTDYLCDAAEFQERIEQISSLSVQQKVDTLLQYIARKSSYPSEYILMHTAMDYPVAYCRNRDELNYYLTCLDGLGMTETTINTRPDEALSIRLTIRGWEHVESLRKPNIESRQAFVAMWFDKELSTAYSKGIATLEEETGYTMLRMDMSHFNDKICDRILAEIRRSRFLIADVTGHRQGVYFEAGFAMGLGLPVIWTCREDQVKEVHFDTRQYNHVVWQTPDDLREKLRNRILATIGGAPPPLQQM